MTLKIFISYAKENLSDALQYFNKLEELGLEPWLDEKKILPGEKWENAILDAFNNSQVIILLISSKSIDKRGFVQKEAKWALKKLEEKLDNDIYIIPIMIERCEVPTSISSIVQYIDGTRDESWMRIVSSLKKAAEQYGIPFSPEKEYGPYIVSTETLNDIWNGKPGYNTEIDYPIFKSLLKNIVAKELSNYFYSRAQCAVINNRVSKLEQYDELPYEIGDFMATNSRWDNFNIEYADPNIISLSYVVNIYYAGAAHHNYEFETFNFDTRDVIRKIELQHIIKNESLPQLSKLVINALCKEYWNRYKVSPDDYQIEQFNEGAGEDWSNFRSYLIGKEGLIFLFSPYQLSSFADGSWIVEIPYYDLRECLQYDGAYNLLISPTP